MPFHRFCWGKSGALHHRGDHITKEIHHGQLSTLGCTRTILACACCFKFFPEGHTMENVSPMLGDRKLGRRVMIESTDPERAYCEPVCHESLTMLRGKG